MEMDRSGLVGWVGMFVMAVALFVLFVGTFNVAAPHLQSTKVACPIFCKQRNNGVPNPDFWDYVDGWIIGGIAQKAAHEFDPRNHYTPSSMGCYCDVEETRGKVIHIVWEEDEKKLREFHLTGKLPGDHRNDYVKEDFYHKDDCEMDDADLNHIVQTNPGCWIYAVDRDGGVEGPDSDGCRLYNVSSGAVLDGKHPTIWKSLGDDNISTDNDWGWDEDGDEFYSPVENKVYHYSSGSVSNTDTIDSTGNKPLRFGDNFINSDFTVMFSDDGKEVHVSQRYLMDDPASYNFTLWKPVVCKNTTRVERFVPQDSCSQNCSINCTDEGMMYYDSKCAKNAPGKYYNSVESPTGANPCDASAGEKCWCTCVGETKYYWETVTGDQISI